MHHIPKLWDQISKNLVNNSVRKVTAEEKCISYVSVCDTLCDTLCLYLKGLHAKLLTP